MKRAMRTPAVLLLPLACLLACARPEPEAPDVSVESGIERSVADVRAAEAAASGPVETARAAADSAAEISARTRQTDQGR